MQSFPPVAVIPTLSGADAEIDEHESDYGDAEEYVPEDDLPVDPKGFQIK